MGGTSLGLAALGTASATDDDSKDDDDDDSDAFVRFDDQVTDGTYVVVEEAKLTTPGFVSIHLGPEFINDDGEPVNAPETIIGYSAFLEAGEYENVEVPLFEDEELPAVEEDEERLDEPTVLVALPHEDANENEEWDFYDVDDPDVAYDFGDTSFAPPSDRATDIAAVVPLEENVGDFAISVLSRDLISQAKFERDFDELSDESQEEVEELYQEQFD